MNTLDQTLLNKLAQHMGIKLGDAVSVDEYSEPVAWNPLENNIQCMAVRLRAKIEVTAEAVRATANRLKLDFDADPQGVSRRTICQLALDKFEAVTAAEPEIEAMSLAA